VTGFAGLRESCRNVIRNGSTQGLRAVPGGGVARVAGGVRRGESVVVIGVARRAGSCGVHTGQWPPRDRMIEGIVGPGDGVVASRTICCREGSSCRRVYWIVGGLPGAQVTAGVAAIGRLDLQIVVVVDVALRTRGHFSCRRHLVRVRQRKTGDAMVEGRISPAGGVVAGGALRDRKTGRNVIWYATAQGLGAVPLRQVASRIATVRRRDPQGVVVIDVTLDTGGGYMSASQREPGDAVIERRHIGPRNGVMAL